MTQNNICWKENYCIEEMNRFYDNHVKGHEPNAHFLNVVDMLKLCGEGKLLDIGTGTAAISEYVKPFEFYGCDLPNILIGCSIRNYPQYFYKSCDIEENNLAWMAKFDVLLLNGMIDVMEEGLYIIRRILTHAKKYVIIHRQEITEQGQTKSVLNGSYGGQTFHSIINRQDFNNLLEEMNFEIVKEIKLTFANWENGGSSFLLKNKVKDLSKYDSHPLRQLKHRIQQANTLKVVIGGGDILHDSDWIVTNVEELDVENEDDFVFLFGDKRADNFLSSHVHEHLNNPDKANENLYKYLKVGGRLRIAVPDGYHPNEDYINEVKVNGTGAGADEHTNLWNVNNLSQCLINNGFEPKNIKFKEYWDNGKFIKYKWKREDGFIQRSAEFDERNVNGELNYTSLIIDAVR